MASVGLSGLADIFLENERNSIRRRLSSAALLPDNCLSRRRYLRIVELQKPNRSLAMNLSKSVAELQREHVVLELKCIDRMYLNAYVPQLTSEAGVAGFVRDTLRARVHRLVTACQARFESCRDLKKSGWHLDRQKGSHRVFKHPKFGRTR